MTTQVNQSPTLFTAIQDYASFQILNRRFRDISMIQSYALSIIDQTSNCAHHLTDKLKTLNTNREYKAIVKLCSAIDEEMKGGEFESRLNLQAKEAIIAGITETAARLLELDDDGLKMLNEDLQKRLINLQSTSSETKNSFNEVISFYVKNQLAKLGFQNQHDIKKLGLMLKIRMANCDHVSIEGQINRIYGELNDLSPHCREKAKQILNALLYFFNSVKATIGYTTGINCYTGAERFRYLEEVANSTSMFASRILSMDADGSKQFIQDSRAGSPKFLCDQISNREFAFLQKVRYIYSDKFVYFDKFWENTNLLLSVFMSDQNALSKFPQYYYGNRKVVYSIVKYIQSKNNFIKFNCFNPSCLSNEIKNDENFFYLCNEHKYTARYIRSASDELKGRLKFMIKLVEKRGALLDLAKNNLQDNLNVVLPAVQNDPVAYKSASQNKQNNPLVITKLVESHWVSEVNGGNNKFAANSIESSQSQAEVNQPSIHSDASDNFFLI